MKALLFTLLTSLIGLNAHAYGEPSRSKYACDNGASLQVTKIQYYGTSIEVEYNEQRIAKTNCSQNTCDAWIGSERGTITFIGSKSIHLDFLGKTIKCERTI